MKHLVFFDGSCGLCDRTVRCLLQCDKANLFVFAPLQGSTAKELLRDLPPELKSLDSLILVENYATKERRYYFQAKAVFKICWLLGGLWKLLGWLSFLPSAPFDAIYRLVARNRHRFFSQDACRIPPNADRHRFLP